MGACWARRELGVNGNMLGYEGTRSEWEHAGLGPGGRELKRE